MITLTMWLLGGIGIGIGIFAASLLALWGAAKMICGNSEERKRITSKNLLFQEQLLLNWSDCNNYHRRKAIALEKIAECMAEDKSQYFSKPTLEVKFGLDIKEFCARIQSINKDLDEVENDLLEKSGLKAKSQPHSTTAP